MKHHLTYKDDKSDKFWNIEVDGNSFTVTYGKTGAKNNSTRSLS
ncbi:WGR domain-containing protein, partial [Leptospira santarosai]